MSLGGCIGAEAASEDVIKMIDERVKFFSENKRVCIPDFFEEMKALKSRITKEIVNPAKSGWY